VKAIASSIHNPRAREAARFASIAFALVAACMLVITIGGTFSSLSQYAEALAPAGAVRVEVPVGPGVPAGQPITSGGSATPFALLPPAGASCPGDSATDGYRFHSYIVPASVDPSTLTWDVSGPVPAGTGAALRQPLFADAPGGGAPFVNKTTAAQSGLLVGFPTTGFSFTVFGTDGATIVPPGNYNIGFACTKTPGALPDRFWNLEIVVTASASDTPGGFTWAPVAGATTTTTTTTTATTTTTVAGATTTVAGATTTTVAGATTTTVAGATTTTVADGASGIVSPASPTPGGRYQVTYPNCFSGETITFSQPQSTPASVTAVCGSSGALTSGTVAGIRRPLQATTGTATGTFTAAPMVAGTYAVTMKGTQSALRTVTFVVVAGSTSGGSGSGGSTSGSSGVIPSTGSSPTALIVWGALLVIFGRMAILLGRKPKVISGA
jgi:hypothetical protein